MAKKFFTDESLSTLVSEIKSYTDDAVLTKADAGHSHSNYVPTSRKVNNKALSSNISLTASDVGALPADTAIPSNLSDLTDDDTHRTVTDTEKATWNAKSTFSGSYNDLTNKPTIPSIEGLATKTYVDEQDNKKVDKVTGKGLSTNDYTTAEKTKLSGIAEGAQVNTITGVKGNSESTYRTGNVNITKANIGLGSVDNTADVNKNVKYATSAGSATKATQDASGNVITSTYETKTDASNKLIAANDYTDEQIALLLNNSSPAVDSIMELATAMENNQTVVDALEEAVGKKASSSHTHTVSHTPAGTVSKPSFTGTEATISTVYTPAGTVSKPSFTGDTVTSGTPSGTAATVASSTHTHKYTPAGTVSKPTFTGSAVTSGASSGTTSVYSATALPSLDMEAVNQCLVITFSEGSRSSVTLPSTSHTHSVTAAGSVSQPTFTGTEAPTTSITGTTNVASTSHTHSVDVSGSVSQPTFTGTEATISATYTPAGSVSQPTFTGTAATLTTSTPK